MLQARTEVEHMRLEVRRLESALERKEIQLLELQVRAVLKCVLLTDAATLPSYFRNHLWELICHFVQMTRHWC